MNVLFDEEIKVRNYKCFGEEGAGFDRIMPINIIIGKNNSGKSSLIDLIRFAYQPGANTLKGENEKLKVIVSKTVENSDVEIENNPAFRSIDSDLGIHLNKKIYFELKPGHGSRQLIEPELSLHYKNKLASIVNRAKLPLAKRIYHITAERDIKPELPIILKEAKLISNGEGATSLIQQFLVSASPKRDRLLIEEMFLKELNLIINPDIKFLRVLIQHYEESNNWEIFLEDEYKNIIPLSEMGSGIKTVLLVLLNLIIMPKVDNVEIRDCVFAFEELENNLHPALQRRLYNYIRDYSLKHHCCFFITTHSNIVIDSFGTYEDAQIIHVQNDGNKSFTKTVLSNQGTKSLLNDLGVKASDLLQSNGVIWVEGPSDRNYLNKWLKMKASKLTEGVEYSIMFYGGSNLANTSFDDEDFNEKFTPLLRMNKNAFIIMDRDGDNEEAELSTAKKRVIDELGKDKCWITKGREIENYLSNELITTWLHDKYKNISDVEFENKVNVRIEDNIVNSHKKVNFKYSSNKTKFSAQISKFIDEESLNYLDLNEKLKGLVKHIKKWNFMD